MASDTTSSIPTPEPSQETLWQEIWARHCMFDEPPFDIRRHLRQRGVKIGVQEIRDAIEWGAENAAQVLSSRRAIRAKMATVIAARRKLILNEIARLHSAQKQRGGIEQITREYGPKGNLKKTIIRISDCSRELLQAERCLAEVDRFCAVADGLGQLDPNANQIQRIEFDLKGFFGSTYDDPSQAQRVLRAPSFPAGGGDQTTPSEPAEAGDPPAGPASTSDEPPPE